MVYRRKIEMKEKIRFQMRISPETDQKVKAVPPLANCQSQNEFVDWLCSITAAVCRRRRPPASARRNSPSPCA